MTAYYNEHDPFAAAWLRELIKAGHIAPGIVDERSIEDVLPDELREFTQCHFFAGIGVWSYALRRAGWPDDKPVWTGSCPCQPFSTAGKGAGFTDERHLWPAWFHLITQCQPGVIFGEQVASKDGLGWLDLVQTDLEGAGYASGALDLCAAGVGAPHIRQRLFFVAEWLGDSKHAGLERLAGHGDDRHQPGRLGTQPGGPVAEAGAAGGMADAESKRQRTNEPGCNSSYGEQLEGAESRGYSGDYGSNDKEQPGPTNGLWRDADWLYCRDGKFRPVEPGTFPLVDGAAEKLVRGSRIGMAIDADKTAEARVMRLKGYGNAINAEAAEHFIRSYLEC